MCPRPRTCLCRGFMPFKFSGASGPFPGQSQSWSPTPTWDSGQGRSTKGAFSAGGRVSHSSGNRHSLGTKQALHHSLPHLLPRPRGRARLQQESMSGSSATQPSQACLPAPQLGEGHRAPQICVQSPQKPPEWQLGLFLTKQAHLLCADILILPAYYNYLQTPWDW